VELTPQQQALLARYNQPQLLQQIVGLQEKLRGTLAAIMRDFHQSLAAVCGASEDEVALRQALALDVDIRVRLAADAFWSQVQELIREWDGGGHD
jgi:hypothetical protein